jgi:isopenicillin-N N-acyltransferase-like protein
MRTYRSAPAQPHARGLDFGASHSADIKRTIAHYDALFQLVAGRYVDLGSEGAEALEAIQTYSPGAADELAGMAAGAGVPTVMLAALNARTEILARLGNVARGECSTVVCLGTSSNPVSVQTWDWYELLQDDWLLWTIEHEDGTVVHTITEYGILGKIGVNNRGVGVHLNILHHREDGGPIAVPVHVLARTVLDRSRGLGDALAEVGAARTSASSVLTLVGADAAGASAICAELSPAGPRYVLPSRAGLLLHTNHFLDPTAAAGDLEPRIGPDSFLRLDVLRRAIAGGHDLDRDAIVTAMASHIGAGGAVCCHPEAAADVGNRWATLVTVSLDVLHGTLSARSGGPCNVSAPWEQVCPTSAANVDERQHRQHGGHARGLEERMLGQ